MVDTTAFVTILRDNSLCSDAHVRLRHSRDGIAMRPSRRLTRVLVIQFWIRELDPIARALSEAGIEAALTRVDIEPALHAALVRDDFDVAIYEPEIPGLSRREIEACLGANGRDLPLVILEDLDSLGTRVAAALAARRN